MGNSIKFTEKGHILVTVHLVEEFLETIDIETESPPRNTLSGFPVAERWKSWEKLKAFAFDTTGRSFSHSSTEINLIVSVEDTGVGIPLEAQTRIFTPFMQVGPSISRTHGGTGIGLSINKCLVGLMKGEIGFASIPKVGSTFTFTAVFGNGLLMTDKKSNRPISSEFQGMEAVVVDHRPVRAKVSRYHFQRLGIHVEVVPDLDQVLRFVKSRTSAMRMVLIEQEIWNRDLGISLLFTENLQKVYPFDAPRLFLLANSARSSRSDTPIVGGFAPAVVTKPLRASMLVATLQQAFGVGNKEAHRLNKELPSASFGNLLLGGRKILIVDDNNVNLRVAAGALKRYGAEVICSSSGVKAISMPLHSFDACFMDIQMPEMDGFEATRRIRDMEREAPGWHVPILAMTADVIQATYEECLKCGMDGYVSKPFEAEMLYREVSRFIPSPVVDNERL